MIKHTNQGSVKTQTATSKCLLQLFYICIFLCMCSHGICMYKYMSILVQGKRGNI